MELTRFIDFLQEEFDDKDLNPVSAATAFRELEDWSSMMALIWISKINDEVGVMVGAEELAAVNTVEDLFRLVQAKTTA